MRTVTFEGKPLHLEGELPVLNTQAPSFTLTATDLSEKRLRDYLGNVLVLASVPSIDTPVCDLEGRHFNDEASKLSDQVRIAVVSCDTPFAQARWCGTAGIKNIVTLSDYKEHDFGRHYGVLIQELKLLARAVFVIDKNGILTYCQLVPEITQQPDYAPVLEAIRKAL
ncbi:MAG: thiol peroxidase [Desulfovibrio sp.]|nr:thiol peroxidase [Desulfovibrio sp.]